MNHNFYPGPSSLHPHFEEAIQSSISSGILSMNHRSTTFSSLYQQCFETIQEKWEIPENYSLLFVSSATEAWEIIAQSLIVDEPSLHIYNGAFGEKPYNVANKLTKEAHAFSFDYNEPLNIQSITEYPFINICQNETSNGTAVSNSLLIELRKKFPKSIVSVDATSSLGGTFLDLSQADIWYSSVQKCMGLPSGMGIILINDNAIEVINRKKISLHYNDFFNIISNTQKWQTTHTPNILSIHALAYTQSRTDNIQVIDNRLRRRKAEILIQLPDHKLLTTSEAITSSTILTFINNNPKKLIEKALKNNIVIGKGYGEKQNNTFRIANFPSITDSSFEKLLHHLK